MAFQCVVVTPEEQALDATVNQAIVPAHDGLMGFLTDRAPALIKLGVGPLRVDLPDGQKRFYLVDGGVAQMKDNRLTVLTSTATPASEIDYEAARVAYTEASARRITDQASFDQRQHDLDRARAQQAMAKS